MLPGFFMSSTLLSFGTRRDLKFPKNAVFRALPRYLRRLIFRVRHNPPTISLWLNVRVPTIAESAFNKLLSDLNRFLRQQGFRRLGQRYGRETQQCWQIIGAQKSRYSDTGEVRFTINFGVTSKALMNFKGEDASKMPLDWTCPIRCRIGELLGSGDLWWSSNEREDFQSALRAITTGLTEKAMPLLSRLDTDAGILALYGTGVVMGFEIDRDEMRAVLTSHLGLLNEASQLVEMYEARWASGPTSKRANSFLVTYNAKLKVAGE